MTPTPLPSAASQLQRQGEEARGPTSPPSVLQTIGGPAQPEATLFGAQEPPEEPLKAEEQK